MDVTPAAAHRQTARKGEAMNEQAMVASGGVESTPSAGNAMQAREVLEEQWRRHVADIVGLSVEICDQQACDRDQPDGAALRATVQLVATQRLTLREIEAALARVESGTYGICEGCGETILAERLEVLPHTRYCVQCQPSRIRQSGSV